MSAEVTRELLQTSPVEGMPGWEMRLFLIKPDRVEVEETALTFCQVRPDDNQRSSRSA